MPMLSFKVPLVLLHLTVLGGCDYCPKPGHSKLQHGHSEGLRFTRGTPETKAFSCNDESVELHCCAEGYDRLQWDTFNPSTGDWEIIRNTYIVNLRQKNQTLVIRYTKAQRGTAVFRCVLHGHNGRQLTNQVEVHFLDCTTWMRPPVSALPGNRTVYVAAGKQLSVPCSGFFGKPCDDIFCQGLEMVYWTKKPMNKSAVFELIRDNDSYPVYTEVDKSRKNDGILAATLVIKRMSDSDFGDYNCFLRNSYGYVKTNLSIKRELEPVALRESAYRLLGGILGGLAILIIMTACVVVIYKRKHSASARERSTESRSQKQQEPMLSASPEEEMKTC